MHEHECCIRNHKFWRICLCRCGKVTKRLYMYCAYVWSLPEMQPANQEGWKYVDYSDSRPAGS